MEKPIVTKRGVFGKIQVTLPMEKKNQLMDWYRQSGLGKTEFFRVALMIGATHLATSIKANEKSEDGNISGASIGQPDVRRMSN